MTQQFGTGTFRRASVTKTLIAEVSRTTHILPKGEGQYEAQTYLSPTGRTIAKIMIAGVATEKEDIGKDESLWRVRVVDPSGAIGVMAGKYQPEAAQVIAQLDIPCYIAIVGKLNIYEPEPGSHIVSIRPDSVTIIDGKTRDDIILDAALSTARSIRKTTADPEIMKRVAEAYVGGHDQDAYMLAAQQAIESLLPTFSAEMVDQNKALEVTEPRDKNEDTKSTVTKTDDKAGEDMKPPAGNKEIKKPDKKELKEGPASPPKTTEKPAKPSSPSSSQTPGKPDQERSAPAYPKKDVKETAPAKGKAGKEIDDSIKTIQEVVLDILNEKREVVYSDLPDLLRNKGINPNVMDWESAVKRLMVVGLCYEPQLGRLKAVR